MITKDLNMDELDRQLEQFRMEDGELEQEEDIAEQVGSGRGVRVWNPFEEKKEEDKSIDDDPDFQVQMTKLEAVRDSLNRKADSARKDYEAVDKVREREGKTILSEWATTLGLLCLIFVILGLTKAPQIIVPWFGLLLLAIGFSVKQILAMLRRTANHNIMCCKDPVSPFVERTKANTYYKQQQYAYAKINEIKGRTEELDRWEKQLRKKGKLTDEELETVANLIHINEHPSIYVNSKFSLGEWMDYIFKK